MNTKLTAAALAGSFAAALAIAASPVFAGPVAEQPGKEQVLRRLARRQERLRRRRRHHLRRHLQGRLSGQCLEICRQGHLRCDADPEGHGLARPDQELSAPSRLFIPPPARGRDQAISHYRKRPHASLLEACPLRPASASSRSISPTSCPAAAESASSRSMPKTTWAQADRRMRCCATLRERFALSVHGVGLSIGGEAPLDREHLSRLKALCDRYRARKLLRASRLVVAWRGLSERSAAPALYESNARPHRRPCRSGAGRRSSARCCWKIRPPICNSRKATFRKPNSCREIARRTGCGLLLDVNNVFVQAQNHGTSPEAYLDAFPLARVKEIHLGGHDEQSDETGAPLLIDAHGSPVADPVWSLFGRGDRRHRAAADADRMGQRRAGFRNACGRGGSRRPHPRARRKAQGGLTCSPIRRPISQPPCSIRIGRCRRG